MMNNQMNEYLRPISPSISPVALMPPLEMESGTCTIDKDGDEILVTLDKRRTVSELLAQLRCGDEDQMYKLTSNGSWSLMFGDSLLVPDAKYKIQMVRVGAPPMKKRKTDKNFRHCDFEFLGNCDPNKGAQTKNCGSHYGFLPNDVVGAFANAGTKVVRTQCREMKRIPWNTKRCLFLFRNRDVFDEYKRKFPTNPEWKEAVGARMYMTKCAKHNDCQFFDGLGEWLHENNEGVKEKGSICRLSYQSLGDERKAVKEAICGWSFYRNDSKRVGEVIDRLFELWETGNEKYGLFITWKHFLDHFHPKWPLILKAMFTLMAYVEDTVLAMQDLKSVPVSFTTLCRVALTFDGLAGHHVVNVANVLTDMCSLLQEFEEVSCDPSRSLGQLQTLLGDRSERELIATKQKRMLPCLSRSTKNPEGFPSVRCFTLIKDNEHGEKTKKIAYVPVTGGIWTDRAKLKEFIQKSVDIHWKLVLENEPITGYLGDSDVDADIDMV